MQVHVRIMAVAARRRGADREEDAIAAATVHQMMTVGDPLGKDGEIAGPHRRLALILDQHRFSVEQHHELILLIVPMALGRHATRFEADLADAEIGDPAGQRQTTEMTLRHLAGKGLGIGGRVARRDRFHIELGHGEAFRWAIPNALARHPP